jgi:hypothetical protein
MFVYHYWDAGEQEVIIQCTGNTRFPLSIRVSEESTTAMVNLSIDEIDHIIGGLQDAKKRILAKRPIE